MRRLSVILIIALLLMGLVYVVGSSLAASASTPGTGGDSPALAATPTAGVSTEATAIPSNINLSGLSSPRVLAWNPNTMQTAWYAASGQPVTVGRAPSAKALVITCGMAPSGDKAIIFQGGDPTQAQPVLLPLDGGSVTSLGTNSGLACSVPGRTQFSPDGNRLGIIKYLPNAVQGNYTVGTLRILKLPEATEQYAVDNVISFDLQNDGAVILEMFANTKKEANSADLVYWDGSKERKLEEDIKALESCQFAAGRSIRSGDKVFTLFGEKCKTGGSKWRLLRTDFGGGNTVNVAQGPTGSNGAALYFNNSGGNDLWALPGGNEVLIAVPNGRSADLVNLARISLADGSLSNVSANVIIPQYPAVNPNRFLFNPKGDMLALVTRDGNGGEKLWLYDLNAAQNQPTQVAGGNRLDRVTGLAWTADGSRLFYTIQGEDNGLISTTTKGETKRVARGMFQGLAIKADGSAASTSSQIQAGTNDIRHNLVLILTDGTPPVNLVEGAKGDSPLLPLAVR
jgi:hypothetical protein